MTIAQAALDFYEYSKVIKGYSPRTIKRYRQSIIFYCNFANAVTFDQVNEENVRQLFYYGRTQRAWSPVTYFSYHKSLTVFFRWCKNQGFLLSNPIDNIEVPKIEKTLPSKLTKQNAQLILEIVDNYPYPRPVSFLRARNHAIFSTFLFAGLRKSELLNLKYTDVDIENMSIFVRQGKGSKDRIIPMPRPLAESLGRYLQERTRAKKTCQFFFTSTHKNMGFCDSGLKRLIERVKKSSQVRFSAHKLRHTFATLMLEGGCDIFSLSKMMGHTDIRTTTIYLAASAEHLRSQMLKHPLNLQNENYRTA